MSSPTRAPRRAPPGSSSTRTTSAAARSEEHTSELQSPCNLVCRLLLEKKKPDRHLHLADRHHQLHRLVFADIHTPRHRLLILTDAPLCTNAPFPSAAHAPLLAHRLQSS